MPNREAENVDHLVRMRPDEMGAEDFTRTVFDQCLVDINGFVDPSCGIPIRGATALNLKASAFLVRLFFAQPYASEGRKRESDTWHPGVVGLLVIALDEVGRNHLRIVARYRGKRRPVGSSIARCLDCRIAFALQEVVQAKPTIPGSYARCLEIKSIKSRNPPCSVNDEIGIELYCPAVTFGVNDIVVTSLFYRSDVQTGLHTYSDPIKGIHQPVHQFRLEAGQHSGSTLHHGNLCPCARSDMSELGRDVAAAHKDDSLW